jgi:hypothetical protein
MTKDESRMSKEARMTNVEHLTARSAKERLLSRSERQPLAAAGVRHSAFEFL